MTDDRRQHCGACGGRLEPVRDGLGRRNPILVHALGICSALAVTGQVRTTLAMAGALLFVTSLSCLFVSLLRTRTPHRGRMIVQMLVIATLVTVVEQVLQAYAWELSRKLGVYVGLIVTNCIVMGRTETIALRCKPVRSFLDGLGAAAGYGAILLAVALIREPFGSGTLLGYRVLPADAPVVKLLQTPPGAFVALACVVWIVRAIWPHAEPDCAHPEGVVR